MHDYCYYYCNGIVIIIIYILFDIIYYRCRPSVPNLPTVESVNITPSLLISNSDVNANQPSDRPNESIKHIFQHDFDLYGVLSRTDYWEAAYRKERLERLRFEALAKSHAMDVTSINISNSDSNNSNSMINNSKNDTNDTETTSILIANTSNEDLGINNKFFTNKVDNSNTTHITSTAIASTSTLTTATIKATSDITHDIIVSI